MAANTLLLLIPLVVWLTGLTTFAAARRWAPSPESPESLPDWAASPRVTAIEFKRGVITSVTYLPSGEADAPAMTDPQLDPVERAALRLAGKRS